MEPISISQMGQQVLCPTEFSRMPSISKLQTVHSTMPLPSPVNKDIRLLNNNNNNNITSNLHLSPQMDLVLTMLWQQTKIIL
jgi:hypothetical protein